MGAMLNAYTSHDLVAFHITSRAESVGKAIDLLTDFVGRPKLDPEELDRERGVVIQEIARANDQPAVLAEHLIDQAAFGDHPLGRPVLGPADHLRSFTREAILAFRGRQWSGARGGAFIVGNLEAIPDDGELAERFGRFPSISANGAREPAPALDPRTLVEERESNQSHLRLSYRPAVDVRAPRERAALSVLSTLLGGSMGSRLFDEIREQRGLAYSVYSLDHAFADAAILQLSAGLESGKCLEAYARMREIVDELRRDGPEGGGVPARAGLRGRPPGAGLREHERRRSPRRHPDGRLRAGDRPGRRHRGAGRGHRWTRSPRSPGASPRPSRWRASARTRRPTSTDAAVRFSAPSDARFPDRGARVSPGRVRTCHACSAGPPPRPPSRRSRATPSA